MLYGQGHLVLLKLEVLYLFKVVLPEMREGLKLINYLLRLLFIQRPADTADKMNSLNTALQCYGSVCNC